MASHLSRRTILRSGSFAVGLPFLDAMMRPRRSQAATPKRFVVFFQPGGNLREKWLPGGADTNFTLSPQLAPLQAWKSKLVIIDGVAMSSTRSGPGDDHLRGMGHQLTAQALQAGSNLGAGLAGGPSVDQVIASKIGAGTPFASKEFGVQTWTGFAPGGGGTAWDYLAYASAGKALPAEDNPTTIFSSMFKGLPAKGATGPDPALVQRLAQRKSVLDFVKGSYSTLLPKVSREDRQRLDAHLTGIRDIETRLTSLNQPPEMSSNCMQPPLSNVGYHDRSKYGEVGKLQSDLLAMALACDLTRVATLQYHRSGSDVVFSWLGITGNHHGIDHEPDSNADAQASILKISKWYNEQLAYLLAKLDSYKEPGGSVLDNSLVLHTVELSRGNVHSHNAQPYVLAGGAGGAVATGRFLKIQNRSHNDLLLTCMAAVGAPAATFGDPSLCTGPLPGVLV
ncbi:MAG: DUF1552 domain-containing protein [Deltaproteobacteria bacterium]|nr:DUF1552 domain-containing protein [Deltaproteobacteria bacterium]